MGYLDGFLVTFRKLRPRQRGRRAVRRVPEGRSAPKAERLHGRHVLNRYEDGMEKCIGCELCAGVCPARCIYVRGADNPIDDPVSPGRALRLRLRDQLPALHPLRPVRRGLPDRGDHRVEAVRVLASPTARDAIYTKDELLVGDDGQPQHLPWEDWRDGRGRRTPRRGCGPPRRRATPPTRAASAWSGELGYGVRRARGRPGRRGRDGRPTAHGRATTATATATHDDADVGRGTDVGTDGVDDRLRRAAAVIVLVGALGVVLLAQPGALRAQPGGHAVRHRRAVPRAGRPLPRRRPGDRLRRRHRRAVPVRDHAARRRPRRGPRAPSRSCGQRTGRGHRRRRPARRRCWSSIVLDRIAASTRRAGTRSHGGKLPTRPTTNVAKLGQVAVHRLPLRLRDHVGAARHRRRRRGGPGPAAAAASRCPTPRSSDEPSARPGSRA